MRMADGMHSTSKIIPIYSFHFCLCIEWNFAFLLFLGCAEANIHRVNKHVKHAQRRRKTYTMLNTRVKIENRVNEKKKGRSVIVKYGNCFSFNSLCLCLCRVVPTPSPARITLALALGLWTSPSTPPALRRHSQYICEIRATRSITNRTQFRSHTNFMKFKYCDRTFELHDSRDTLQHIPRRECVCVCRSARNVHRRWFPMPHRNRVHSLSLQFYIKSQKCIASSAWPSSTVSLFGERAKTNFRTWNFYFNTLPVHPWNAMIIIYACGCNGMGAVCRRDEAGVDEWNGMLFIFLYHSSPFSYGCCRCYTLPAATQSSDGDRDSVSLFFSPFLHFAPR